jgi:hypothetical protein
MTFRYWITWLQLWFCKAVVSTMLKRFLHSLLIPNFLFKAHENKANVQAKFWLNLTFCLLISTLPFSFPIWEHASYLHFIYKILNSISMENLNSRKLSEFHMTPPTWVNLTWNLHKSTLCFSVETYPCPTERKSTAETDWVRCEYYKRVSSSSCHDCWLIWEGWKWCSDDA